MKKVHLVLRKVPGTKGSFSPNQFSKVQIGSGEARTTHTATVNTNKVIFKMTNASDMLIV